MAKQTFTTGQVLTAAQMTSLQQTAMGGGAATAKTANYTLVAADAGATVIMNSASATTITVNTSLFSAGDTVFIQNIGAGVSTITAGTATVNTASSLALAQYESGNLYFTAAGASIFSKADGAAAGGGGKVLQVVYGSSTTATTVSGTSYAETGLSASITPSLATSKVLVMVQQGFQVQRAANQSFSGLKILRDATVVLACGDRSGSNTFDGNASHSNIGGTQFAQYLDTPSTTSSITYKTQGACISGGDVVFQIGSGSDAMSNIILMEIGA